eukprot:6490673-Amphidinium_carterae.1
MSSANKPFLSRTLFAARNKKPFCVRGAPCPSQRTRRSEPSCLGAALRKPSKKLAAPSSVGKRRAALCT